MHFSNLNREICGYLDGEVALTEEQKALLLTQMSFCDKREDADILIFDRTPEDYDVKRDVPLLCVEETQNKDGFVPESWTAEELAAYLSCAVAGRSTRDALQEKTPFVACMAADDGRFCRMLCDILRDAQDLDCVGITNMEHVQNARGCVVYLDQALLSDKSAKEACPAMNIPLLVVTANGISHAQAKEFCPNAYDICDLYDVWQLQGSLRRMLNLCDADMGFYAGLLSLYGIGRRRDVAHGVQCIRRSAQMGDAKALLFLSLCCRYAVGCEKSDARSDRLMAQAAQNLLDEKKERTAADIRDLAVLSDFICTDLQRRGRVQRARVIGVQAYRLCKTYIESHDEADAIPACADTAKRAAELAHVCGDQNAYVELYLDYARLTYRGRIDMGDGAPVSAELCDAVLSCLDAIAQYLLSDDTQTDLALVCVEIGTMWQQYVFDVRGDDTARAALATYLEQRGLLYLQKADARAVEDFAKCIELCRDYTQHDNAARFEACSYLNLGKAYYACENYEDSYTAIEKAQQLWQARYDAVQDVQNASAICDAAQSLAKTAVAMRHEDAIGLCHAAVECCEGYANIFQSASVWESLAKSYGIRAKYVSPSAMSVEGYKKEACVWQQLYELTYETAYDAAGKQALALAKADEKILAPPTAWQTFVNKVRSMKKN